jgi:hypothetical protein|nr:MAG TPA: hypothetical protein [Caudoviricetes sp.]
MSKKNVSKNIEEVVDATGKVAEQVAETVEETVEDVQDTMTIEVEEPKGKVKQWIVKNRPWLKKVGFATLGVTVLGFAAKALADASRNDGDDATDEDDFDLGSDDSDNTEE